MRTGEPLPLTTVLIVLVLGSGIFALCYFAIGLPLWLSIGLGVILAPFVRGAGRILSGADDERLLANEREYQARERARAERYRRPRP